MEPRERAIVERVLVEEFGLTAIDDPDTARLLLQNKLSELDPFERRALEKRIGTELKQAQAGYPPRLLLVVPYALMSVVGWFIWHPLAAVFAIFGAGLMYRPVTARLYYWSLTTVFAVGAMYGFGLAAFVSFFCLLAGIGKVGTGGLAVLGLLCAGHVGYRMAPQIAVDRDIDRKHNAVQFAALVSYVVASVVLFLIMGTHRP
jgi:hypothetical protein